MGTLTYSDVRLPEYCEHKLPTSCRLSSIPNCCACADERAHAPAYACYLDGIGFVTRGNRWQRYCWYCKEFWEKRVEASGLRPAQTRIPEVPDQTEFLERWYEFHRGYRIVTNAEGREERVAVLGEDFMNVSPGLLPRTLDELREGRRAAEVQQQARQIAVEEQQEAGPSLEETLDTMFTDAANEEAAQSRDGPSQAPQPQQTPFVESQPPNSGTTQNINGQAMNPPPSRSREYQVRRVAALRRELTRMRTGIERVISGLRDLGEDVPNDTESVEVINRLDAIIERPIREIPRESRTTAQPSSDRTLSGIQARIDEARGEVAIARQARDNAASEHEAAQSAFNEVSRRLEQIQREQRTMENYMRVFGTREEMIAQGENYESPIGGMFTRAMERFRVAEEVRREERSLRQVLEDEARIDSNEAVARRLEELESRERDVWGVPNLPRRRATPSSPTAAPLLAASLAASAQLRAVGDTELRPSDSEGSNEITAPHHVATRESYGVTSTAEVADRAVSETPPDLADTNEETMLQEHYNLIRRQDWNQQLRSSNIEQPEDELNFPRNMLNAIVAARSTEVTEAQQQNDEVSVESEDAANEPQRLSAYFSEDEWWHEDAEIVARTLTEDENMRGEFDMSLRDATTLLASIQDDMISESQRMLLDALLQDERVIWRAGLPTEWLRRRTELVEQAVISPNGFFTGDGGIHGSEAWATHYNPYMQVEMTAQSFMMSAGVRQSATLLSPTTRMELLDRLYAGRRTIEDVRLLEQMVDYDPTFTLVSRVYRRSYIREEDEASLRQAAALNEERMRAARSRDSSRRELETRRQEAATHAFALAAGRQAMQTGPQALIDRAAAVTAAAEAIANSTEDNDREAGMRAAYRRLNNNTGFARRPGRTALYRQLTLSDYVTSSPGSSRSSSPEPSRGLDARDSGRPEPKSDEELVVSMECKICYTQIAEIACLPCGHLVMCKWCSEQHSPCLGHDHTRPRRSAFCPVCRKSIKQKVRVWRG